MSKYFHIKAKPVSVRISSINGDKGHKLNDLEATLLCFQKLIDQKVKEGKKGIILYKNSESEYKMSYKKLQSMLFELKVVFSMRGAISFGICGDCENFENSCSSDGTYGYCSLGNEKYMFDSCENFIGESGFGKIE